MNIFIVGAAIFAVSLLVLEMSVYAYKSIRHPDRGQIRKRLTTLAPREDGGQSIDILKKKALSDVPLLNTILLGIPGIQSLARLTQQANVKYPLGFFLLLGGVLALTGYLACSLWTTGPFVTVIAAAALGSLPLGYLRWKKKQRMEKFYRQLPEGLELVGRALRAGHAFTSGMKLAAEEFDDPLGPEFDQTLDEINFGIGVPEALKNLAGRIDCPDLKYFVVSVILQRETGGNLAEIIESIAHLIRERFKLKGKIRVLAAEGKLTAIILIGLPFVVVGAIRFLNPEYISALWLDPTGRIMAGIALSMMAVGVIFIKKMVNIDV